MKLKKIGISLRVETIEKYDERRDTISHDWINFLQKLNFIPILIPNNLQDTEGYISELKLDGIILSGGDNLGEFPERDETESRVTNFFPLFVKTTFTDDFFLSSNLIKSKDL